MSDFNNYEDIKKLNNNQLQNLAQQIRSEILSVTKKNGGHLSSNLGMIETTIAIHKVFSLPKDKLVFDVGHQCYAHKFLTKRDKEFSTIRTQDGLSGFPDISESEFDAFSTGHAGTSLSAGLGMCFARDKIGEDYTVISLVGDGSIVNGLNLEALSNSTTKPKNFIVILNDNGMSISANKNGFYKLISKSTINKGYVKGKKTIKKLFGKSFITNFFVGIRNFVKRLFGGYNYFEQVGFKYVCGVDGNDLSKMVKVLQKVKELAKEKAVLLHIKTTKGKGYEKAEEFSDVYHGVGKNYKQSLGDFGKQLANKINSLISTDDKIVAITAGMKDGTGLSLVEQKFPKNFVDVGIAEEYAVTLAAGMAKGGLKPIVAIYSTFLQRAYDQILHDVCMQNLPVVFCIDRAGFVGEDGKTHQGLFDLSYLSHMPNMTILTPSDPKQFAFALDYALSLQTPVAIRYPKTSSIEVDGLDYQQGKCQIVEKGDNNFTILAVGGKMIKLAKEFSLVSKTKPTIVYVRTVKPFDKDLLQTLSGKVITLEENVLIGGFGSAVSACFSGDNNVKVYNVGVEDEFVKHGSIDSQMVQNNITIQRLLDIENFN